MRTDRTKHRPPARVRYAESHPAITLRLPDRETRARIDELSQRAGVPAGQIVKQALGLVEKSVDQGEAAYVAGYELGYADGQEYAVGEYRLNVPCAGCGELIEVEAGSESGQGRGRVPG